MTQICRQPCSSDPSEVLDEVVLLQLKALEDPNVQDDRFVDDLIALFKRETPPLVTALAERAMALDFRQVESLAHKIKGFARNLGAKTLAASCEDVESGCRRQSRETLLTAAQILAVKTEEAIELLDAYWRKQSLGES